jgi:hypothetical protein
MPALVAVQYEPHVRAFHEALVARGKTKMQANVAVMRKLLHTIDGMWKSGERFDPDRFYRMAASQRREYLSVNMVNRERRSTRVVT